MELRPPMETMPARSFFSGGDPARKEDAISASRMAAGVLMHMERWWGGFKYPSSSAGFGSFGHSPE